MLIQRIDILSVKKHFSGGFWYKAEYGPSDRGFSAAGFADKSHGLTFFDRKSYSVDCFNVPGNAGEKSVSDRKPGFKIGDFYYVIIVVNDSFCRIVCGIHIFAHLLPPFSVLVSMREFILFS
jgi:hypothetical protein